MKLPILILFFSLILIFFPFFIFSQLPQQVEISISAQVGVTPPPPPPPGIIIPPLPGEIIFQGMTSPFANLTILKNGVVISTFPAKETGLFERGITLLPGEYKFGIFAQDREGRISPTFGFTAPVFSLKTTKVSGIFIPPTIEISNPKIIKGEILKIFGQVFPQSKVQVFILPENIFFEATPSIDGKWIFELDTNLLKEGEHKVQAKAISIDGIQSPFSQEIPFFVLKPEIVCKGADLNFDEKVDLIDFSILLYFWGQKKPENFCADINQDGIVDLIDFSIMMYYWTG